jgi:hypothetical protein
VVGGGGRIGAAGLHLAAPAGRLEHQAPVSPVNPRSVRMGGGHGLRRSTGCG